MDISIELHWLVFLSFSTGLLAGTFTTVFVLWSEVRKLKQLAQANCLHTHTHTYVESATVTCEKTIVICLECDKELASITDCR